MLQTVTENEIFRSAISIKKSLGVRRAAGFLRNKGVSCEVALFVLLGVA